MTAVTGVVSGQESADADAQTTPEGEAEQLAIAAALKAGVTKNSCRIRTYQTCVKHLQTVLLSFVICALVAGQATRCP